MEEKKELKKKRFIARKASWNKHFTNVLKNENDQSFVEIAEEINQELQKDYRIKYSIFSIERGKKQNNLSFHLQGYLEFKTTVDLNSFNKNYDFFIQDSKGNQQQNLDYVKKTSSKIFKSFFEFGTPKQQKLLRRYNTQDEEIPKEMDLQMILLDERFQKNHYQNFEDIKKDFILLFLKHEK